MPASIFTLRPSQRASPAIGVLLQSQAGEVHLLHHHPHADEWYYVIEGSARFTVGDEVIRGEPGTAMFLPAGVPHRIDNDGAERLHFVWGFDRPELAEVGIVWDE